MQIEWEFKPYKNKKKIFLYFILVVPFLIFMYWAGGLFWLIFSIFFISLATFQFFVKTNYKIDEEFLYIKMIGSKAKKYKLKYFKRFEIFKNGIYLSPYKKKRRFLELFRGVFLHVEEDSQKEKVASFLEKIYGKS